jgi:large subunit ribosomal protein L12
LRIKNKNLMEEGKMEYVYTAMLLHKAGQKVDEGNVKKVLEAASVKVDEARVKALVAALEGVNIDETIEKAAVPVAATSAAPAAEAASGEAKKAEDPKKKATEEKKSEEQAAAGLGSLFG